MPLIGGDPHRVIESPGVYMQVRLACEDATTRSTWSGSRSLACPGSSTSPTPATSPGRSPTRWPTTRTSYDEALRRRRSTRRDGDDRGARRGPGTSRSLATERGPVFEVDAPRPRAEPARRLDRARRPRLRRAPPAAARAHRRRRRPRPRRAGWSRSTTSSSPTRTAPCATASPAGCPAAEANRRGIVAGATRPGVDRLARPAPPRRGARRPGRHRQRAPRPESDLLGTEFAPPHRADRIHALLRRPRRPDRRRLRGHPRRHVLLRHRGAPVRELVPGPAGERPPGDPAGTARWRPTRRGAAAFAAWRSRADAGGSRAEPVFAPLLDEPSHATAVRARGSTLAGRVGLALLEPLAAARTPFGIDLPARPATEALDDAGRPPGDMGRRPTCCDPVHAFDVPMADLEPPGACRYAGARATSTACAAPGRLPRHHRRVLPRLGGALRLGPRRPRRAGGWVVPLGAAGDPRSPAPPRPAAAVGRGAAGADRARLGAAHPEDDP